MARRSAALAVLASLFLVCLGQARAQIGAAYPTKPVKVVVNMAPGGANDVIARILGQKLTDQLKQPFIVENRAGAGGIPGADYVAKSAPDGYTVLVGSTTVFAIQPSLFSKLPYDIARDFAAISIVAISPGVLVVNSAVPAHNLKELIALARASPGKLNYASPGNGTPMHLSGELFKARTATDIVHVPYKGAAPALADLLAGQTQLMFANVLDVLAHINSGKLRPIASLGAGRIGLLPDVPTVAESGFGDAQSVLFFAAAAPKGTPRDIIDKLHLEIVNAGKQPEVRRRFADLGCDLVASSPVAAETFIRSETEKWAKVVRESGAKVDN